MLLLQGTSPECSPQLLSDPQTPHLSAGFCTLQAGLALLPLALFLNQCSVIKRARMVTSPQWAHYYLILTATVLLPALSPLENEYPVFLSVGEEQPLQIHREGDPWLPWLTLLQDSTVSTHLEVTVVTSCNYRLSVFLDHPQ